VLTRLLHRIAADPRAYDAVQRLVGCRQNLRRLAPHLADSGGQIVLDLGAGTGTCRRLVPPSGRYVWLDNDPRKLRAFRARQPSATAVLGDAARIGLRDKSVDVILCVAVSHHLQDGELRDLLAECARVCRGKLIFLDAVKQSASRLSRWMWKYEEQYAVLHHYVLWVGRPKVVAK
jgi:ubiquinone/menaquinone biosynthesis C-methylase UbiE